MKNTIKLFGIAILLVVLSNCFSPYKGNEGTVSINIGGGNSGARQIWNNLETNDFEHKITVSGGPGREQTQISAGAQTVSFTVAPGRWNISVEARLKDDNNVLVASSSTDVDIKSGKNTPVNIKMNKQPYALVVRVIKGQDGSWNNEVYGTVTGSGNYSKGQEVTVTATPNDGYVFNKCVSENKIDATTVFEEWIEARSYTFTITESTPLTLYVVFEGNGSEGTPKNITSVDDLLDKFKMDGNYALMTDLDFSNLDDEWTPIGIDDDDPFTGTFDGRGHTINLGTNKVGIVEDQMYAGLFGVIGDRGVVKNLKLKGSRTFSENLTSVLSAGAVAGCNRGTIRNVVSEIIINTDYSYGLYAGGIAGKNEGTILNCSSTGGIFAQGNAGGDVGGIVGWNGSNTKNGTIKNCWASGTIKGDYIAGGIAGRLNGTIENCVALNDSITIVYGYTAGRIAGMDENNPTAPLPNNYANKNMKVNDNLISETDSGYGADKIHGANLSNNTKPAWENGGPGWTIYNSPSEASEEWPWVWDTAHSRPKLWFEQGD